MAVFYFLICEKLTTETILLELPDLSAAKREAVRATMDLANDSLGAACYLSSVRVMTEDGAEVLAVDFSVKSFGGGSPP